MATTTEGLVSPRWCEVGRQQGIVERWWWWCAFDGKHPLTCAAGEPSGLRLSTEASFPDPFTRPKIGRATPRSCSSRSVSSSQQPHSSSRPPRIRPRLATPREWVAALAVVSGISKSRKHARVNAPGSVPESPQKVLLRLSEHTQRDERIDPFPRSENSERAFPRARIRACCETERAFRSGSARMNASAASASRSRTRRLARVVDCYLAPSELSWIFPNSSTAKTREMHSLRLPPKTLARSSFPGEREGRGRGGEQRVRTHRIDGWTDG